MAARRERWRTRPRASCTARSEGGEMRKQRRQTYRCVDEAQGEPVGVGGVHRRTDRIGRAVATLGAGAERDGERRQIERIERDGLAAVIEGVQRDDVRRACA